ncbi:PhoH family protein [Myxococcota bacterium]|nr:PhoH family protein [Myxococcota bacterium]
MPETTPASLRVEFEDHDAFQHVAGQHQQHLRILERSLGVRVGARGTVVTIQGEPEAAAVAERALRELEGLARKGFPLGPVEVSQAVRLCAGDPATHLDDYFGDTLVTSARGRPVTPRSPAQKRYVQAIREKGIVFGIGPAGTGKTYLAMAMAVGALNQREVARIVLARPAVEAGERLGFLPGDLQEKVNPYLRPLYDALHDMMDVERAQRHLERGIIEVAPLAFMRGRTLNDAFVILDEAQNTTPEQMKMFLTRLGVNSKAVVTGDVTQIDLPIEKRSGLVEATQILKDIEDIGFVTFSDADVVRHPLVQAIIKAYERAEERARGPARSGGGRDGGVRAQ